MPASQYSQNDIAGVGIGLRSAHYGHILEHQPKVPWFEALTDNYLNDGGLPLWHLEQVRQLYPVTFHGVGLSLGSTDPLNQDYLRRLKALIERFQPYHVSDHLCWTAVNGLHSNDLLPMPYTEEAERHLADRIQQVQEYLGQRILVENVSSYLSYHGDAVTEWEFLLSVVKAADCDLLCDVNNIYVSAQNHGFDADDYLYAVPPECVKEIHLAGFEDQGTHLLDTHGAAVHDPVWTLYEKAIKYLGDVPTLIEWDNNIPDFPVVEIEATKARRILEKTIVAA